MLGGFLGGLIVAWILSLFGVDIMVIDVMQTFTDSITITTSFYYVLFGIIGAIGGVFKITYHNGGK